MFCKWMKEWWNVLWIEWIYWLLNLEWKWPLGEHGGLGDVHGFDQERKEVEWKEVCRKENSNSDLNWAVVHSRSAGGQLSVNRQIHFGQPTANRVQFISIYRNMFFDRESSISRRPTDMLNVSRPTANRGKFGSISRMVIFCQEIWRSAVDRPTLTYSASRQVTGVDRVFKIDLFCGIFVGVKT